MGLECSALRRVRQEDNIGGVRGVVRSRFGVMLGLLEFFKVFSLGLADLQLAGGANLLVVIKGAIGKRDVLELCKRAFGDLRVEVCVPAEDFCSAA